MVGRGTALPWPSVIWPMVALKRLPRAWAVWSGRNAAGCCTRRPRGERAAQSAGTDWIASSLMTRGSYRLGGCRSDGERGGTGMDSLNWALGIGMDPKTFNVLQVSLRAFVIYLGGLAILRIGENRFLGKFTAFDIILGFVLGGILSRAINGSGPLFPTLIATILLVSLHFLLARTAFHSRRFGQVVK